MSHFAMELLRLSTSIQVTHLPYKGAAPAMVGLVSGEAQVAFLVLPVAQPQAQATVATGIPTRIATGKPEPVVPAPQDAEPQPPAPRRAMQAGMRPLVIAIDAGHGGQDPGAHGLHGTREKDVTLAIARELARQVNATPGMKAFLTRDTDVFIPLGQRARRASANKADIFLSIHADAAENRKARGSSVYVLSTRGASSQRARWLADKENAADIIGGERVRVADNTLKSVLLDLTLPDGDGLTVLERLTSRGAAPRVTVALTGHDDEVTRNRCLRAGCRAVLVKPMSTLALPGQLATWLAESVEVRSGSSAPPA